MSFLNEDEIVAKIAEVRLKVKEINEIAAELAKDQIMSDFDIASTHTMNGVTVYKITCEFSKKY